MSTLMNNQHYVLDRNIISLIKESINNKTMSDPNKTKMLEKLKFIDQKSSKIYAFNSVLEGETGSLELPAQRMSTAEKEESYLNQFFKRADIDIPRIKDKNLLNTPLELNAGKIVEFIDFFYKKWAENETKNSIKNEKRNFLSQEIMDYYFADLELQATGSHLFLLTFLACIYGQREAIQILKPNKSNSYNTINDLLLINRWIRLELTLKQANQNNISCYNGFSKAMSNALKFGSKNLQIHLLTLDKALDQYSKDLKFCINQIYFTHMIKITNYDIIKINEKLKIPTNILNSLDTPSQNPR